MRCSPLGSARVAPLSLLRFESSPGREVGSALREKEEVACAIAHCGRRGKHLSFAAITPALAGKRALPQEKEQRRAP